MSVVWPTDVKLWTYNALGPLFQKIFNLDQIDPDLEIPCFAIQDHLIHLTFMPVF